MRSSNLFGLLGLIFTVSFVMSTNSLGQSPLDPNTAFGKLAEYANAHLSNIVRYRQFEVRATVAEWETMRRQLSKSNPEALQNIETAAEQWALNLTSQRRACWDFFSRTEPGTWRVTMTRVESLDTTQADIVAEAAERGAKANPTPRLIERLVQKGLQIDVEDSRVVKYSTAPESIHPLKDLDIRLMPWDQAIGRAIPQQEVKHHLDGDLAHLVYTNKHDDGRESRAVYIFDATRSWRPKSVRTYRNDDVAAEHMYCFSDASNGSDVPVAVAHAEYRQNGEVVVQLIIMQSWHSQVKADDFAMALPAARFEVHLQNPNAPLAYYVAPSYLLGLPENERLLAAVQYVLLHLNTDDPDGDFNADGTVDQMDLLHVVTLQWL